MVEMIKSVKELKCPFSADCYECCLETEMILLNDEIKAIENMGYKKNQFVKEIDGFLQLKNIDGHCYFLKNKKCSIYKNRPRGCKYYPLIYDLESEEYIIDQLCPHHQDFSAQDFQNLYNEVFKLVNRLLEEKIKRENTMKD